MNNLEQLLKSCSRDSNAYEKLKAVTDQLKHEKQAAERRLELLERSIRDDYDAIMITTLDLENPEIVYVNRGFTRITGYMPEEVIGKTPRILQGPKTDRAVLEKLKERLQEGQAFFGQAVNYKKDGSEFINQWDIHPLLNDEGEITHWVSYQHDISERKRLEEKLVNLETEFDNLTEESRKIWVEVSDEGKIISSNRAFRILTGYENEELKELYIWEVAVSGDQKQLRDEFWTLHSVDHEILYEFELQTKLGQKIDVNAEPKILSAGSEKVIRLIIENRSIQKRIADVLTRRRDLAANQSKEFAYKIVPGSEGSYIIKYTSDGFRDITEMTAGSVKELPFTELVHNDDHEKVREHFDIVFSGKTHTEQFRIKTKGGDYIEIIDYAKPEWGENSKTPEAVKGTISAEIPSEIG